MTISKETLQDLRNMQGTAIRHAVEEMTAADKLGLETKEERGDRGFLSGMAAKSLGVAVRIEQMLVMLERPAGAWGGRTDDDEVREQAAQRMLEKAKSEAGDILERVRARMPSLDG